MSHNVSGQKLLIPIKDYMLINYIEDGQIKIKYSKVWIPCGCRVAD